MISEVHRPSGPASRLARGKCAGFTLVEMLVGSSILSLVFLGVVSVSFFSSRMVARNLATNRTHDVVRMSDLQFLRYLHESGSAFRLLNFDGTSYTDLTPTATTDVDATSGRTVSTRANGVRFRRLGGGPYRLTANTTSSSTNLTFNFSVGGQVAYVPKVGDKLVLPLIAREYDITAVPVVPTAGAPTGTVTISGSAGLGFTLDATTAGNVTTAYFYESVAFIVWGGQLRFHNDFSGTRRGQFTLVRSDITSPQPFALLFPAAGGTTPDGLNLRVSLEAHDGMHSARQFTNGTATLHTVIPTRTSPTPISSTNY